MSQVNPDLVKLIVQLHEYYSKDASNLAIEAYVDVLGKYPLAAVRKAVKRLLAESRWLPRAAEIRELLEGGSPQQRAARAWSQVLAALSQYGSSRPLIFDHAATHVALAEVGGWRRLCQTPSQDVHWVGKEFIERYSDAVRRLDLEVDVPFAKVINRLPEGRKAMPVTVGDAARAREVFARGVSETERAMLEHSTLCGEPRLVSGQAKQARIIPLERSRLENDDE